LYWAKFARLIVEHLSFNTHDDNWVKFLEYAINVCRHEGGAYSRLGLRQQAMAYRTLARFAWVSGDMTTWEETVKTAVVLTWESGLRHSYHALLNEFKILPVTHQPGLQKASGIFLFDSQLELLRTGG